MATVHRRDIISIRTELVDESIYIMERVVHGNTDADGRDGDGQHIQRDLEPAHETEYETTGQQIGGDGDQCDVVWSKLCQKQIQ